MKATHICTLIVGLLIIGSLGSPANSMSFRGKASQSRTDAVPTVSICDLLRHPESYNQKRLRVNGVYARLLLDSVYELFLYDPACNEGSEQKLSLELDAESEEKWNKLKAEMWKKFPPGQCDKANIIVVGTFGIENYGRANGSPAKHCFIVTKLEQGECVKIVSHYLGW